MTERNDWCFGCGRSNPIGLKLQFEEIDDTYVTHFTAGPEHQGYDGIIHGGLVSTLLDETMARYIYSQGLNAVTARLEIRYRLPTPVGEPLTIRSRIISKRGQTYQMEGEIKLTDGTITAEGKSTVVVIRGESK